jgi:hypothetical protein
MKNAQGMIRSTPVMRSKPAVMHHMEIHPQLGGGVRMEMHHTEPGVHPPKVTKFGKEEGNKFHAAMEKHTGMSWNPEEGDDEPNAGKENEVDRGDNTEA